ncbi:hypothetical protein PtrSN002B_002443 [Pyrenophora tritici-repentis]|nr:hypothetical protein A1F94_010993 [Pyrenophora tritici-repentis]KAI0583100.1 hypothetical protein Alg215_03760 [Pyrenophora tritici-repentis]KAI0589861.1 hypothetical protein Alg130_02731 [Pyrenophora tritici-repentis]KAI0612986.1 hypothetical protein TUN205_02749 [Pyrenophora tritici-repentis]KAI0624847.1 hypothetical protein TUN199_03134 [Pyrenophora tritici-repentis]
MARDSLFSPVHTRGVYAPKKLRGFLALPAEIRNQIYNYYFEAENHCEITRKSHQPQQQKKPLTVKLCSALIAPTPISSAPDTSNTVPVIRFTRCLGNYNIIQGLQTNWLGSLYALSLVCKQVYAETVTYMYLTTVFIFDAPKRMTNFFDVVSSTRLGCITKLQLHYDTYGHPKSTHNVIWQDKHGRSWHRVCKAASKKLVNLQSLTIWAQIHDCAPKFTLREKWIEPLLQFRRLNRQKDLTRKAATAESAQSIGSCSCLQSVTVHVQTRWSKNPLAAFRNNRSLARASTALHLLYGQAISLAIMGAAEYEAMSGFKAAWEGEYAEWRYHLQFARTGW